MQLRLKYLGIILIHISLFESVALGQFAGSRAAVETHSETVDDMPLLTRDVVEGFIAIDGRAEMRVKPTEIRIVLAVTSEGVSAHECQTVVQDTMTKLKTSWSKLGIPQEKIVEDFIAVLPLYEWNIEKRNGSDVGIEKKRGFRMQTNVHLAVPDDASASKALTPAFEQGVTDIIAFDYWSQELDAAKTKVREQAIKAARSKADLLLAAFFDDRPAVVNLQEKTTTRFPESLYHSFVNSHDEEFSAPWQRDISIIRAYRPRNTYYRGLYPDGDIQPRELPMHPEISVVSTIRLYFESPLARRTMKANEKAKE